MNKLYHITIVLFLVIIASSCKVGRFVYYNFADIKDYEKFPYRTAQAAPKPFYFSYAKEQIKPKGSYKDKSIDFDQYLADNKTVAFLIIQNDSIKYERYFNDYKEDSRVTSFSMAKSIISILIGKAIEEGKIKSVQEPITNYIPELKANGFDQVTIEHVLQMTSGLEFKEQYTNPFGHVATYYYGRRLRKAIPKLKLATKPGITFNYVSGNTELLGLILERALNGPSITSYLESTLWQPLGMEYDATWSLDRKNNGLEKTFCCINARAKDFAKIGRLYLNGGNWNGQQIINNDWVKTSTSLDTSNSSAWYYQYQWWLPTKEGDFLAKGILGQYIYVHPKKNLIIVRLGKNKGSVAWEQFFVDLAKQF